MKLSEIKRVFNYAIANNHDLIAKNKKPVALCIEGECGIGKTAILEEIATERNMTYIKLVLSELEETGDLAGFPIKQYLVKEISDGVVTSEKWVSEAALFTYTNQPCGTYEITSQTRMAYAPPAWLPTEENPNGTILNLDDYSRATPNFIQATMNLIDKGTYMTWKLPKNTTIVLSTNPDDGKYAVSSLDPAQLSRMCQFKAEFNIDDWARWAEMAEIDSRAINFALMYSTELFESKDHRVASINARSYTNFCNMIQGLNDWSSLENQGLIINISKGCFNDDDGIVGALFSRFVSQKLDKLVSPDKLLSEKWETVLPKVLDCVYTNDSYNNAIAAILSTRITNYSIKYLNTAGSKEDVVNDRLLKYLEYSRKEKTIFTEDLIFNICRVLVNNCPKKTKKLLTIPAIRQSLLS